MDLESDVQQVALMEKPGDANGTVALRVNLFDCTVYFCYCFLFFVIFRPLAAGANKFPRLWDLGLPIPIQHLFCQKFCFFVSSLKIERFLQYNFSNSVVS